MKVQILKRPPLTWRMVIDFTNGKPRAWESIFWIPCGPTSFRCAFTGVCMMYTMAISDCLLKDSHTLCTIGSKPARLVFGRFSIADAPRIG